MLYINCILFITCFYLYFNSINYFFNKIFKLNLDNELSSSLNKESIFFFKIFLIFFIGIGLVFSISNLFFINNLEIFYLKVFFIFISFLSLTFIHPKICKNYKSLKKIMERLNFIEKKYLYIFFLIFLIFFNRIFLNWNDEDEIKIYGYMTRLYAEGWRFSEGLFEPFTRYGEISHSIFYDVTNSFVLARLIRLIMFVCVLFMFFALIKILTKSNQISFISVLLLSLSPEFSYVGYFSMKTDFLLFVFEMLSIIFLFLFIYFSQNKNKKFEFLNLLISSSLIFASISFATRLSGIYLFILVFSIYSYLIFKKFDFYKKNFLFLLILVSIISITVFPHLIKNIIEFNNPLYPLNGFWNIFFENPVYDSFWNLRDAKNNYNINLGYPVLNEVYLIIYNSFGISRSFMDNYHSYFLHSKDAASAGWITPISLIVFLIPFYWNSNKNIRYFFLVFLILFLFWSNGIQFVRVFIATSSISIVILALILIDRSKNKIIISKILKYLSLGTILVLTFYHTLISFKNNPFGPTLLIDDNKKYYMNLIKSMDRTEWDKYINFKNMLNSNKLKYYKKNLNSINENYFSKGDIYKLNYLLNNREEKILIRHNLYSLPYLETILNKGYIVRDNENGYKVRKILKTKDDVLNCYLGKYKKLEDENFKELYTNSKISLFCKKINNQ